MNLSKLKEIDNTQLYSFNREQTQVFLTARVGDGCIGENNNRSIYYCTNCKYIEYLEFKKRLLNKGTIGVTKNNGYSKSIIYTLYGGAYKDLKYIKEMSLSSVLHSLDTLGLALWFYDDGSLHKRKLFYNLNTQKFTKEEHESVIIPYFESIGITAKLRIDKSKKQPLYYLSIGKYDGAYDISSILSKYPVNCYSYKLWSSETIQKWSKLQEELKSTDKVFSYRQLSAMLDAL